MEQKHTPEPWGPKTEVYISAKAGEEIGPLFVYPHGHRKDLCYANASRIVACVNACAGVPTELLEEYPSPFSEMRSQRDMLLEALECLFDSYKRLTDSGDAGNLGVEDTDEGKKALAAIAAVKGDK